MKQALRRAVYDSELGIEACRFQGRVQTFPNHFHEYYVIGLVEKGERSLFCKGREYTIGQGSVVLFHPGDSHGCTQSGNGVFDYRSLHLSRETMLALAEEITGRRALPGFSRTVMNDPELACCLRTLHEAIMDGAGDLKKEEQLLFLLSGLMQNYGQPFERCIPPCSREVEQVCSFIRGHYQERITLEQLCRCGGLSKSTLLRAFTREKGVTPYRYLETVRISEAKALLGRGVQPAEAAIQTGFSDQSHFTNYFSSFIGLAPGRYRDIFMDRPGEG